MASSFEKSLIPAEIVSRTLQVEGVIGSGGFAVVIQATRRSQSDGPELPSPGPICVSVSDPAAGSVRAVKSFAVKALLRTPDQRICLLQDNEVRLHNRASGHPSVLPLYNVVEEGLFTYMVMELCPYGDLFQVIESGYFMNNVRALKSTYSQLLDAVVHCHNLGIFHRDIKPENILVKSYEDDCPRIALADFGLATEDFNGSGVVGSEMYMSPECLGLFKNAMPHYGCAANDVWSMGIILSLLIFGPRVPWSMASEHCPSFSTYCQNIRGYFIECFSLTSEANDLLTSIFELNPFQRIGIHDLQENFHLVDQFALPYSMEQLGPSEANEEPASHTNASPVPDAGSFDPFGLRDSIADALNLTHGPEVSPDCDLPKVSHAGFQQEQPALFMEEPLQVISIHTPPPEVDLIPLTVAESSTCDTETTNADPSLPEDITYPPDDDAFPDAHSPHVPLIVLDSEDPFSDHTEFRQPALGKYILQQRGQTKRPRRFFSGYQPSPLRQCISSSSFQSSNSSTSSLDDSELDYPQSTSSSITSTSSCSDDSNIPLTPPTIIFGELIQIADEDPRSSVVEEVSRKLEDLRCNIASDSIVKCSVDEVKDKLSIPMFTVGRPLTRWPVRTLNEEAEMAEMPLRTRSIQEWINQRQISRE